MYYKHLTTAKFVCAKFTLYIHFTNLMALFEQQAEAAATAAINKHIQVAHYKRGI